MQTTQSNGLSFDNLKVPGKVISLQRHARVKGAAEIAGMDINKKGALSLSLKKNLLLANSFIKDGNRILIVDSSYEILEMFSFVLEVKGYKPETVSSPDVLSDLLLLYRPNLVLMEIMLNGTDGRELCKEINAKNHTDPIPVILMSTNPQLLNNYREYAAVDAIEKPFGINKMFEKINSILASGLDGYQKQTIPVLEQVG
jgi:CheY-like chemotaxis protein